MRTLVVYTAITGAIEDRLAPVAVPRDIGGRDVRFVCFSEHLKSRPGSGWELHRPQYHHPDPRVVARWHKVMCHKLFANSSFTLWHDGSHSLQVNPWVIVDKELNGGQIIGTFRHPQRECLYEEVIACIRLGKDSPLKLMRQAKRYFEAGYPPRNGLYETACVVRRTCAAVAQLNELWWVEIAHGSCRDQVSLPYALWRIGYSKVAVLRGSRDGSPYFRYRPHARVSALR
jgi:hypothetical protein